MLWKYSGNAIKCRIVHICASQRKDIRGYNGKMKGYCMKLTLSLFPRLSKINLSIIPERPLYYLSIISERPHLPQNAAISSIVILYAFTISSDTGYIRALSGIFTNQSSISMVSRKPGRLYRAPNSFTILMASPVVILYLS